MPAPPWKAAIGIDPVVSSWLASGYVRPCLTADRELAPTVGRLAPIPSWLSAPLADALRARGIEEL